ncbi:MAG: SusC/RagA family TonB-linked outer membrane protein, partial [Bacteroidota bacterium]
MKRVLLLFAACALSLSMWAQSNVSGTVSNGDSGEPIEGAAVLVKGTTIGMFTDAEGRYELSVPEGANTLVFTFVGMKKEEVAIDGRSTVDLAMTPDVLELDEVVVTAVGIETNRRELGYSIQNVDSEDIVNARETNLVNALNSKVAGVTVVSSAGSPGASANIRVRGSTSINGSNSPLFVVDGVPIDNSESGNGTAGVDQSNRAIDINPNDIASLTVLKGPAATVLYGIRAANGAIIITTKSGQTGKPKVTLNVGYGINQVNKMPERQSTFAQGRPGTYRGPETAEGFSWGPAIADLEYDGNADYPYDPNGALVAKGTGNGVPAQAYDPYSFFVNGTNQDFNASVSGGTQRLNYYLSAGRLYSTGTVPLADFARNSFKARIESNITEKLTIGMSATFVQSGGYRIQRGSNLDGIMLGLMRTTPTFDNGNGQVGFAAAEDVSTYELADGSQRSYRAGVYDNPYWTINKNPFNDDVNRIIGYASAKYQFTPWLSLSYKLGMDFFTDRRKGAFDINPSPFGFNWSEGTVYQSFRSSRDLNSDLLLQANKTFGNLSVNATLGHNYYHTRGTTQSATGNVLASPNFYHISNATDVIAGESFGERKLVGVFGTVNFNYNDYLFLNVSGRNDWSSSLPQANSRFFYPAVSGGFAITEALGMQNNPILPYAKIRASWGQVGNDAPIYATTNYFNAAQAGGDGFIGNTLFPAFGLNAFERSTVLGNDQLKAETTTTWEIGGELKFLQGRLGADITYYNSVSRDIILSVQIPAPTGFTNFVQNTGVISNKGWEIVLDATPIKMGDFSWDISVNYTTYQNTVDSLADGIENVFLAGFTSTSARAIAGQPYSALFGTGFQKDDAGRTIIGEDGWPLVDPTAKILGDPNPDWLAGIRNTFSYKGVRLSVLFDLRQGGDMWCGTCGVIDYFGTSAKTGEERTNTNFVFDGVKEDGTENATPVALFKEDGGLGDIYWVRYGFGGIGEMSIYDTSWQRLREITLSYAVPASALSNSPLGGINVSVYGRNLWLNTDYPGIDPETNLTGASNGIGLDYFNMPNAKSFGV